MNRLNSLIRNSFTLFLLLFATVSFCRAEVSVQAQVDKTSVALNDSVQLNVVISGSGNVPSPQLPDLSAFNVYSSGRSQNVSIVNGKVSSSIVYSYSLSPKSVGNCAIAPVSVTIDGKKYESAPIEIEVVAASESSVPERVSRSRKNGSAKSPSGAFTKMIVDKSKVYINEPLVATFKFYYRLPLAAPPEYEPPAWTGFLSESCLARSNP